MPKQTDGRSPLNNLYYGTVKLVFRIYLSVMFRLSDSGRENQPASGGALLVCNHQSYFDPAIVGVVFRRRINYMARESLFHFAPFRWAISAMDAIPINRDGMSIAGLKETLRRLRRGEMVLIFPEGTRTEDGNIQPLKPGFVALARRARVPLVPMALAGAYDAWPRQQRFPRPTVVHLHIDEPITPAEVAELDDAALIERLQSRIEVCHRRAEQVRRRRLGLTTTVEAAATADPPVGTGDDGAAPSEAV
jgi:1-acyl-sn-glycerol-3-phosphate acyltransferase